MKVLHVISDLGAGGAPAVLASLVTVDAANEHVVVSLMARQSYGDFIAAAGVRVIDLGMPRGFVTWGGLAGLRRAIRETDPDVVQTWMYHGDLIGGLAARLCGIRTVSWGIHNSDLSAARTPWRSRLVARICAALDRRVPARIVSCSLAAATVHVAIGYDAARMRVVHNGYDLARFRVDPEARAATRMRLGVDADTLLVGDVARWHPVKDHETLCAALATLPAEIEANGRRAPWRLVLVGPEMDERNAALDALLAAHGLRERTLLLGECADVPGLLAGLDLHVLPSAGEAFPNAVAESMACGVPCVATDVGDAALIVDDPALVVPARDPASLGRVTRAALEQVLALRADAPALEARRRALHRSIAERFSVEAMVGGYVAVWREMLADAVPAGRR